MTSPSQPSGPRRWLAIAALAFAVPLAASAQEAYTRGSPTLFAGPSPDYPAVARLAPGQSLSVVGCTDGYGWCDVVLPDGLRGWVAANRLEYDYAGDTLPLATYGAAIGVPIVGFTLGNYWSNYYRDRPWYREPRWWGNRPPPPPVPGWRPPPPPTLGWAPRPPGPGWNAPPPRPGWSGPPPRQEWNAPPPRPEWNGPPPRPEWNGGPPRPGWGGQPQRPEWNGRPPPAPMQPPPVAMPRPQPQFPMQPPPQQQPRPPMAAPQPQQQPRPPMAAPQPPVPVQAAPQPRFPMGAMPRPHVVMPPDGGNPDRP